MYSNRRFTDQSAAGLDAIARRLLIWSANLISLASLLFLWSGFDLLTLSFVLLMTISATCFSEFPGDSRPALPDPRRRRAAD
jgi:hypothetical protein